jgi:hypothetical protein
MIQDTLLQIFLFYPSSVIYYKLEQKNIALNILKAKSHTDQKLYFLLKTDISIIQNVDYKIIKFSYIDELILAGYLILFSHIDLLIYAVSEMTCLESIKKVQNMTFIILLDRFFLIDQLIYQFL